FFFAHAATPHSYSLSLHDALPIFFDDLQSLLVLVDVDPGVGQNHAFVGVVRRESAVREARLFPHVDKELGMDEAPQDPVEKLERSEEHTSELQSRENLVCRLLLEK